LRDSPSLWSRLILHFWFLEAERDTKWSAFTEDSPEPNPIEYLQRADEQTITATSSPNEWHGTTTACAAILASSPIKKDTLKPPHPVLYATSLGDSQILVLRPRQNQIIYKTAEQWHWFDCPRQLGTNSPDTPRANAVMDKVDIEEEDVVLAMSDGVVDNLWEHEVLENVVESVHKWESGEAGQGSGNRRGGAGGGMQFVATELVKAARAIAEDPFAESPYMERAIEEGLPMEGGSSPAHIAQASKGE
jgi:protein phosphatase PTC7